MEYNYDYETARKIIDRLNEKVKIIINSELNPYLGMRGLDSKN